MNFMNENFLLRTETSRRLFYDYAKTPQIFDFHCHLSPKAIYENGNFKDITEAWLGGDHYKWRAMRSCGIPEELVTGNGDSFSKFEAYATTLQYAVGNPLYHWSHLELQRFFGIQEPLTKKSARRIFDAVNERLSSDEFKLRNLIKKSNVRIIYTTDDPVDDLKYHDMIKGIEGFDTKVSPAFRPDKAINIELPGFASYINTLGKAAGSDIKSFGDVLKALESRINFFAEAGCRASDHGVETVPFSDASESEINAVFEAAMRGDAISREQADKYKTAVFRFLGREYAKHNWVMEIHVGVLRNNNAAMFRKLGPDTGFDSIGDFSHAAGLIKFLDSLESEGKLPKTVLFSANPNDNYIIATMIGCFQNKNDKDDKDANEASTVVSKIQSGTAWWFNDSIDGMRAQMSALGNVGVLGKFIGMLTDSRSFLSYPRHEYFRRIFCDMLGTWIENGEYFADEEFLKELIEGICINNALKYFDEK